MISIVKEVTVSVDVKEVALLFCSMDNNEMALFFNHIAENVKETWENPFEFQMADVETSKFLTQEGREVMRIIGEYSNMKHLPF